MPPMASSSATTNTSDIDKLLKGEATAFQRDYEVDRILKTFKLNPYEILDLEETCTPEEIKKKYRTLSLFIHPDKTSNPKAPEAFDLLKKAESDLGNKDKREELDALIKQARIQLLKSHSLPTTLTVTDERVQALRPPFKSQLRATVKDMLIEEEVRRRKAIKINLANEGLEAQMKEVEVQTKKRKAEEDQRWEEGREGRVGSWRSFANNASAAKKPKTKKKSAILG